VEAEQRYWARKRGLSPEAAAAEHEFSRIMHAYLSPRDAIQAAMNTVTGKGSDYRESRSGAQDPAPAAELGLDENQRAGLDYGRGSIGPGSRGRPSAEHRPG
jgi:hypothetical protein